MTGDELYKIGYSVLRIFHWGMFFVAVEIMFWLAGWMIFGTLGNFLAWIAVSLWDWNLGLGFHQTVEMAGKVVGLIAGIFAMWFVMGRYRKSVS